MHFLIFVGLYFLPAIIAAARHTHNSTGILLLNLFLGWTMIGWFVALLMAIFSRSYYGPYYGPYCGPYRASHYYHRGW
jgi:Superinfection immunity protein